MMKDDCGSDLKYHAYVKSCNHFFFELQVVCFVGLD